MCGRIPLGRLGQAVLLYQREAKWKTCISNSALVCAGLFLAVGATNAVWYLGKRASLVRKVLAVCRLFWLFPPGSLEQVYVCLASICSLRKSTQKTQIIYCFANLQQHMCVHRQVQV